MKILPLVLGLLALALPGRAQPAAPKDPTVPPPAAPTEPAAATVFNPALPTIWIAGDSTAARGPEVANGWGMSFPTFFDLTKVNVVNCARGGASTRTFISQGLWDKLIAGIRVGDTVLIQFGHNDGGPVNEDASVPKEKRRSRGTIPTLGEETQEIDNIITGKHEVVHTFGWYLRKMIADVKARGGKPVVLSMTVRNEWKDGKVERINGPYRRFSRETAAEQGVPFIDLTRIIADTYQQLGPDKVKTFFPKDHTHNGPEGAELNASLVVAGLKGIRRGGYAALLSPKGAAVEEDRIGWLNLPEPADPKLPSIVLVGDSLVRNGRGDGAGGQWGWGDSLGQFFDPAKVNVVNRAVGGLSSRTFLTQGHWERALTLIKPGDFVLIQLGHNDPGPTNDTSRARGTLTGVGEETEEIDNLMTKKHEVVHTFGWYVRKFVREAKAAGATPIVCSLTPRRSWKDGRIVRSTESYGGWARQVATEEGVAFIDANDLIATRYEALGDAAVTALFGDVNLHTNRAGADLNAAIIATELAKLPALAPLARTPHW